MQSGKTRRHRKVVLPETVQVRMTDGEKTTLVAMAERAGMSLSEYTRSLLHKVLTKESVDRTEERLRIMGQIVEQNLLAAVANGEKVSQVKVEELERVGAIGTERWFLPLDWIAKGVNA